MGLTTAPYHEAVQWTVFKQPNNVTANVLETFRSLLRDGNNKIPQNYRDIQPLNGRVVKLLKSKVVFEEKASAPVADSPHCTCGAEVGSSKCVLCIVFIAFCIGSLLNSDPK